MVTTENPESRSSPPLLSLELSRSFKVNVDSGRTPESPDAYSGSRVYRRRRSSLLSRLLLCALYIYIYIYLFGYRLYRIARSYIERYIISIRININHIIISSIMSIIVHIRYMHIYIYIYTYIYIYICTYRMLRAAAALPPARQL